MTVLEAVISGIVQGLTEFLPVSSSGHLVILHKIFGFKEPQLAFDIFLHIGTMISVLIFFAKDIVNIIFKDRKMMLLLILACVPTFIIGFLSKNIVERLFGASLTVGYALVITGFWLLAAHFLAIKNKATHAVSWLDSIIIGIAQGIAVIPGISRSGATIGAGLMLGLEGSTTVRFSFLLSVPAILGASAIKFAHIEKSLSGAATAPFIAGAAAALFTGILAIYLLLKAVKTSKLWAFGVYCVLVGAITVFLSR
ncbi:MAG: undecaprenyl-diphosphate phosphatase [Candidatus Omnitrophica bacterium]|nr:undecaprenyl-diphosphate phosphatase [Candidatus Omnitrophota bacterium]